ncbi:MAG TPA: hypothetical protein VGY97_12150 [Solirubrobacteraceae bacterium]|nr:hypothetical protein [Solirubrobacteraceae bacterium]
MSFLLDPPLLVATGATIERLGCSQATARRAELAAVASFWAVSGALYANWKPTRGLSRALRSSSGRDFMLGSGLKSFAGYRAGPGTHLLAIGLFLLYPAWVKLGRILAAGPDPR